ncbi:MAG: hypothetical protein HOL13_00340 [Phycisphaerae bacterium]|nr:hypothetical protein [Phycisphaerae bacterium]
MSHVLFVIDQLRQEDDAIALAAIAQGLMDAGIDQTHLLASPSDGQQISPILEGVDCISTRMPRRWWGRARTAQDCAAHFARRPVDLVFWSGDQAASLSRELAAELESPLIGDVWKRSQVDAAKRSPLVDAWIARTDSLSVQLRDELKAGTVITANSILGGHETRTGFRRRNAQLTCSEMGALSVKVEGINVRLHPTDREVYAEMQVLLNQSMSRSVRTLHGITGEAGDVPLSAALEFALEGVGGLIEAPVSARHTIVRFSASYWSTLQAALPHARHAVDDRNWMRETQNSTAQGR